MICVLRRRGYLLAALWASFFNHNIWILGQALPIGTPASSTCSMCWCCLTQCHTLGTGQANKAFAIADLVQKRTVAVQW